MIPSSFILPPSSAFPATRLRRTRRTAWLREMLAETRLHPSDLILPVFIQEGTNQRTPIASLPGAERMSVDLLAPLAREAAALGIPALALFPATDPRLKDARGSEALNPDNLVCRAIRTLKDAVSEIGVIADVALDPYTSHGQDGLLENGVILNDQTVEILCQQSLNQARAGCDILAPSDMMDGRIGAIRRALEAEGFTDTLLLAYSAKYASALYGPFRDAVGSSAALSGMDKKTYQMNPANGDEALREIALDIAEGADMIMVKPALPYLDIVRRASENFAVPVLAYQVSGEYAMLHAFGNAALQEALLGIKRAGARAIFTYGALAVAKMLR